MGETYDLAKTLEDLLRDEAAGGSEDRIISQEDIGKLLAEKRLALRRQKMGVKSLLGELMVMEGMISHEQLESALAHQSLNGGKLGSTLVEMGYASLEQLQKSLGAQLGLESATLLDLDLDERALGLFPVRTILDRRILPLKIEDTYIKIGMENPSDMSAIHMVEFFSNRRVIPVVVPSCQMNQAMSYIEERDNALISGAEMMHALKGSGTLQILLDHLISIKGSDLLISAGLRPAIKWNGTLVQSEAEPLSPEQCAAFAKSMMSETQWESFLRKRELDFSYVYDGVGRFRVNAYRQKDTVSLAIRRISEEIPSFSQLGLPEWLGDYSLKKQGLILITAPTGQGKTTTIASMIEQINRKRRCNIVTIEDPIEYLHKPRLSHINQREVGTDTESFSEGLRRIFRQAPDVIVIGEMRDRESFEIGITCATTGHLVLSTMHSPNTTAAVESIIGRFQPYLQNQIRQQLAEALLLVLSQRIIPGVKEGTNVLAYEKLTSSIRIKNLIRENKAHQIRAQIQAESEDFVSMDFNLVRLVNDGKISMNNALLHAVDPDYVQSMARKA